MEAAISALGEAHTRSKRERVAIACGGGKGRTGAAMLLLVHQQSRARPRRRLGAPELLPTGSKDAMAAAVGKDVARQDIWQDR